MALPSRLIGSEPDETLRSSDTRLVLPRDTSVFAMSVYDEGAG